MSTLRLGVAKIDISPEQYVPLAGFGNRKGLMEGVAAPIFLRANAFIQRVDGVERRALVVQADIIWWGPERMEGIRRRLADSFGLKPELMILSATHTHGAPQTTFAFIETLGLPETAYIEQLEESLIEAVREAFERAEPVRIERGRGECRIGIHRRKLVDGIMEMAPNPDGPLDPHVELVRFITDSGDTSAVWLHYTCHPTTTGVNSLHGDFPGAASERLEMYLGGGAVVSFLQGCCGDTRPALIRDNKFYSGTLEEAEELGLQLADAAEEVFAAGRFASIEPGILDGRQVVVGLPFQPLPSMAEIAATADHPGVPSEWARKLTSQPELLQPEIPLELTKLELAPDLSLLAMNGEIVLEYGLKVKRLSGGSTLPLGYCNGMVGYVPTAAQVDEGGYEGGGSSKLFSLPAVFDRSLEQVIEAGIAELTKQKGR
ncbi:neutral/alkaline non-lysosomal ceramidase N-terminal domain-containing protein [Paenibacillus koleovorans]|uniref:neutral/alkaline non-lysosomal ceramidase N-terminal domain-containing protein n=1 Tax=Paenibacillus koleovorans TaxID=121608 RepID=UPI000FD9F1B5|nr:neutral/alkaline non-lysosomal ceramidase N-terminal domain-containing protein [Paenibacillus koleovorans]